MLNNALVQRIKAYIYQHELIAQESSILIGLSGGPDSVFLLHVLSHLAPQLSLSLYAAHLDHEWRSSSHEEMLFCQRMAAEHHIPFFHTKASQVSIQHTPRGSWEAYARSLRRSYFQQLQQEHGIDYIALAHHKDDQRETFFIRLLRGAGLKGISGMRPQDGPFIRPLLTLDKSEIRHALDNQDIEYVEDPSNLSETMLRNRIRNHVIPTLEQCDYRATSSLDRTIQHLQQAQDYLEQHVTAVYPQFTCTMQNKTGLAIAQTLDAHSYLRRAILLYWLIEHNVPFTPTRALFQEIERFLRNQKSKKHEIRPQWYLYKDRGIVYMHRVS